MSKNQTRIIAEPGKQELFIIREFDYPRELVFKAHTDAKIYSQWLGPDGFTLVMEKFEANTGGSYRHISTDKDGNSYAFHGVYHEVLAPERIIGTFEFEGLPEKGHVEFDTQRFEELPGGRTRVTIQAVYQSVQDRDGMVSSGMESGITQGHEKLDIVLSKLK
ncbi:MAG TPA: SRPBCC family protein [Chitinophagaceae bacterium]|nr:SRPBCC family protein [Chitinophagaceae bacterium]